MRKLIDRWWRLPALSAKPNEVVAQCNDELAVIADRRSAA